MPLEGQQLGHYRLLRLLGSGGMGDVYLAEDIRIAQQVAIKVIRSEEVAYPDSKSGKDASRLFEREARAIARLDHPNILPLYSYGEETAGDRIFTYLVMPYRKDGTLATWLRQRATTGLLSPAEVAALLTQAADALQHAHDQQILHQDIKPTNFLIRVRKGQLPDLLLADFGIAKFTTATATASQSIRGTPAYMAPEQWDGHPVAATDQYALAIMVYELLTGHPPFQGNLGQIMRQHFQTPPARPSTLNPALPPALDTVLLRALAKEPEERFPSVTDFAQAFAEAVQAPTPTPTRAEPPAAALLPTLKGTTPLPGQDTRSTLVISQAEAKSGTRRMLTLPGGRRTTITIPAGAYDGQVLRFEALGESSSTGGPAGALVITLALQEAEQPAHTAQAVDSGQGASAPLPTLHPPAPIATSDPTIEDGSTSVAEDETARATPSSSSTPGATIPASSPSIASPSAGTSAVNPQATTIPASSPSIASPSTGTSAVNPQATTRPVSHTGQQASVPLAAHTTRQEQRSLAPTVKPGPPPQSRPRGRRKGRVLLLAALACLVVIGSAGILFTSIANQVANNTHATATEETYASATAHNNATATKYASNIQTATSASNATATAQVVAATATVAALPVLYAQITSRTPTLNDPLSNNSQGSGWDENGYCFFSGYGTYYTMGNIRRTSACLAHNTNFGNFVFQVQMSFVNNVIQCGGLVFRVNNGGSGYELFYCSSSYSQTFYSKKGCSFFGLGSQSSNVSGDDFFCTVNQSNLIAVMAIGNTFSFFVNRHFIGSVTDSNYHQGQIGLDVENNNDGPRNPWQEVAYSNAQVWAA